MVDLLMMYAICVGLCFSFATAFKVPVSISLLKKKASYTRRKTSSTGVSVVVGVYGGVHGYRTFWTGVDTLDFFEFSVVSAILVVIYVCLLYLIELAAISYTIICLVLSFVLYLLYRL
ncbi:hypothetical protein G7K_1048-t1 [Saitoella complicata NRRL Y-17804]|uniref:Uncharacterized protein n=1 Tax=Saitoella complicata (strain BCRC 22490 / CBS 7301 / JCM 7358 / NBRC 10748 / NRRL Y-17804) TaxID=698492 RepID=A0A0E9NBQ6_SAICN|nr:hypothetical protein G7K_1048-t1 [Saitoella complicata NRRL Y-17804]